MNRGIQPTNSRIPLQWAVVLILLFAGAFLFLFILRNWGIHNDEAQFLGFAQNSQLGDFSINGKPPFWYFFNFHLSSLLQRYFAISSVLSPIIFHVLFYAAAVGTTAFLVAKDFEVFSWLCLALLCSPISLVNGLSFMSESLVLALVAAFSVLLFSPLAERSKLSPLHLSALATLSTLAILSKAKSAIPLTLGILLALRANRKGALASLIGVVVSAGTIYRFFLLQDNFKATAYASTQLKWGTSAFSWRLLDFTASRL